MFEKTPIRESGLRDIDGQRVYWEESGRRPALYLHCGPGGTLGSGGYATKFDPERFRIIGIDQRGCGRSRPLVRDPDPTVRDAASEAWAAWEDWQVSILSGYRRDPRWDDPHFRQVFVTLTTHYWANDAFLDPPILDQMDRLAGIPGVLIHGRRDVSWPMITARELHRSWPGSE